MNSFVYWIYDSTCNNPYNSGYVGVSKDALSRFKAHKLKNKNIPKSDTLNFKILYEGSREECFLLEKEYRPNKNIGWNNAIGGSHGWKCGFSHSNESKNKMQNAWTLERKEKASKWKSEHNKSFIGQKRPKQSQSISGEKNPMYGKSHNLEARQKISAAHLGKEASNKIESYCIWCHKRVTPSISLKYHGPKKKNCIGK